MLPGQVTLAQVAVGPVPGRLIRVSKFPVLPPGGAVPSVPVITGVKGVVCCFSNGASTSELLLLASALSRCPNARGITWIARKISTRKNALQPRRVIILVVVRLFILSSWGI